MTASGAELEMFGRMGLKIHPPINFHMNLRFYITFLHGPQVNGHLNEQEQGLRRAIFCYKIFHACVQRKICLIHKWEGKGLFFL